MKRSSAICALSLAAVLGGCTGAVITPYTEETQSLIGPAPRLNTTPMASALSCMRQVRGRQDLRIGVSDLVDGTGVMEGLSQNSRALSQRPDMMMVVALAATGAQLVNRSSVNVAEWELNKAMEKKLGDGRSAMVEDQRVAFRPVRAGTLLGSTHYVTGAITELNWNISSGVAEAGAYSAALGKRTYRIGIAVDIVVTNTQTTEIVHARSYKKQLVGMETTANFFRFFARDSLLGAIAQGNGTTKAITDALELFNANLGEKQNEPTQTALRWVIELAAYDVMRSLRRGGATCDQYLPPDSLEGAVNPAAFAAAPPAPPTYGATISRRAQAEPQSPAVAVAAASEPAPVPAASSAPLPQPAAVAAAASSEVRAAEQYEAAPPPPPAARPAERNPAPRNAASETQRRPAQRTSAASTGARETSSSQAQNSRSASRPTQTARAAPKKEEPSQEEAAPVVVAQSQQPAPSAPPEPEVRSDGVRLMSGAAAPLAPAFNR